MGKRKCYKQAYGKGSAEDAKKFKYSASAINCKESTRGFLLSYRRNQLKPAMREAFNTIKYFTDLVYPGSLKNDKAKESEKKDSEEGVILDVEAELLKESTEKDERIFNIFETGVAQTFFMEMKSETFDSTKITDKMWDDILNDKVGNNVLAPRYMERVLPINRVCAASKDTIKDTLLSLIDSKFAELNEPDEYYIMPRVRFHPSLERDHLLELVREAMTEKRPDCKLNWKNYSTVIFVEVLKKNCYIGIFTQWTDRTKYNWQEHHKRATAKIQQKSENIDSIPAEGKTTESGNKNSNEKNTNENGNIIEKKVAKPEIKLEDEAVIQPEKVPKSGTTELKSDTKVA